MPVLAKIGQLRMGVFAARAERLQQGDPNGPNSRYHGPERGVARGSSGFWGCGMIVLINIKMAVLVFRWRDAAYSSRSWRSRAGCDQED